MPETVAGTGLGPKHDRRNRIALHWHDRGDAGVSSAVCNGDAQAHLPAFVPEQDTAHTFSTEQDIHARDASVKKTIVIVA